MHESKLLYYHIQLKITSHCYHNYYKSFKYTMHASLLNQDTFEQRTLFDVAIIWVLTTK